MYDLSSELISFYHAVQTVPIASVSLACSLARGFVGLFISKSRDKIGLEDVEFSLFSQAMK